MTWRILLVLLALATTACGRSGNADGSVDGDVRSVPTTGDSAMQPTVTPTALPSVERDMLAALDGFVTSTIRVNDPPDVNHPDLGRFRTGAVLENATASVHLNQLVGIGFRLPTGSVYSHTPRIKALGDTSAVVHDCVVDDVQQVNMADGRVLNNAVATKLFETTLVLSDGLWKVAENSLVQRWEGVTTCERSAS